MLYMLTQTVSSMFYKTKGGKSVWPWCP